MAGRLQIVLGIAVAAGTGLAGPGGAVRAEAIPGYGDYLAWEDWARVPTGMRAGLASSYDRDGANYDFSQYEDPTGLILDDRVVTAATITGPGVVYRFWMPHYTANQGFAVRLYFDGEVTPRIDSDSSAVLAGGYGYLAEPLVSTFAGGQVCYEPIPFASSLRIETENKALPSHPSWSVNRHYYQYTYATFAPGTSINSYTGTLTPAEQAARDAVVGLFQNAGSHPAGTAPAAVTLSTPASVVPAGGTLTLADLAGPGLVRRVNVRMDATTDNDLDGLELRVRYDGGAEPAIRVPVGEFFGAGHLRAAYRSLPLGTDSPDGFYCYWPMPFHRAVSVELRNTTASAIMVDAAVVEYEAGPVDGDMGYLHVGRSASVKTGTEIHHPMLSVSGRGHYVGNLLYVQQSDSSAFNFRVLEGDEVVTVDGSDVLHGTGLEDAYNGGYYYNWVGSPGDEPEGAEPQSAIRPLHGILYVHRDEASPIVRADQYRWLIADRAPFEESIEVKIENRYGVVGAEFTSVAFCYELPPVPGDFDNDRDVDGDDAAHLLACPSGANVPVSPGCDDTDLDLDGDNDQNDFGLFQRCLTGANVEGDPACAD